MAAFALKVKTKSGQHIIRSLTGDSTIANLKQSLSELTNIKSIRLHILFGFPPKPLNLSSSGQTLNNAGVFSGDTLIVDEKEPQVFENEVISEPNSLDTNSQAIGIDRPGILMKKVVPSDNSCLFTSIGFVVNGKVDTTVSSYMREIIAQVVSSDTETYSEGFLGKPNRDYCDWIQNPNSWGGAIEVSVLSRFYGIEMAVVDTLNAIINRFGEDQNYGQRVFLLFDGVHYDPLYLEQIQGGIQTIFAIEDEDILREAEQLAKEAKSARQFTDLNKFTLKCMVCNILLTGQVEAQKHAMETAHASFGEV